MGKPTEANDKLTEFQALCTRLGIAIGQKDWPLVRKLADLVVKRREELRR